MYILKHLFHYSILLFFLSCENKEEIIEATPIYYWGEATAIIDGISWDGEVNIAAQYQEECSEKFSILIHCKNNVGITHRSFSITYIDYQKGENNIISKTNCNNTNKAAIFYTTLIDGDVLGDIYQVTSLENSNNTIEITQVKPKTQEVYGKYNTQLYLKRPSGIGNKEVDTIYIEGNFHTKVLPSGEDDYQNFL